jgi:hypothetical protein
VHNSIRRIGQTAQNDNIADLQLGERQWHEAR